MRVDEGQLHANLFYISKFKKTLLAKKNWAPSKLCATFLLNFDHIYLNLPFFKSLSFACWNTMVCFVKIWWSVVLYKSIKIKCYITLRFARLDNWQITTRGVQKIMSLSRFHTIDIWASFHAWLCSSFIYGRFSDHVLSSNTPPRSWYITRTRDTLWKYDW